MPQRQGATPFPQAIGQAQPQYIQQPQRQWQAPANQGTPSLAYLASGIAPAQTQAQLPYKARGVAQETPPTPKKFVMPGPEEVGVATNLSLPRQQQAAPASIDWNAVHARIERLGTLKFEKDRTPTGQAKVTLLLPTRDPALAQPVIAVAATEAEAIASALQYAEAWMQRR